jgi:hypothetical protein
MIRVANWQRFEVNAKGRVAQAGEKLRSKPLEYVRQPVHGHSIPYSFIELRDVARPDYVMMVWGLFEKFVDIAADNIASKRGKLLKENGDPYSYDDLARLLGVPPWQVMYACWALERVGWIKNDELIADRPEIPGESGGAGKSGSVQDETKRKEQRRKEQNGPDFSGPLSPVRSDSDSLSLSVPVSVSVSSAQPNPPPSDSQSAQGRPDNAHAADSAHVFASSTNVTVKVLLLRDNLDSMLNPRSLSDRTGLSRITHFVVERCQQGQWEPERAFADVLRLAGQAARGDHPMRYFNWLVQKELGYKPAKLTARPPPKDG